MAGVCVLVLPEGKLAAAAPAPVSDNEDDMRNEECLPVDESRRSCSSVYCRISCSSEWTVTKLSNETMNESNELSPNKGTGTMRERRKKG